MSIKITRLVSFALLTLVMSNVAVASTALYEKSRLHNSQILLHVGECEIHPETCVIIC